MAYGYGPVQTRQRTYTLPDIQSIQSFARMGDLTEMESWAADIVPPRWRGRETIGALTRDGGCVVGEVGEGRRVACDDAGLDDDDAGLAVLERMLWEGQPVVSTAARIQLNDRLRADSALATQRRELVPVLPWSSQLPSSTELASVESMFVRDEAAVALSQVRLEAHRVNLERRIYFDEIWVDDGEYVFSVSFVDDFVEGVALPVDEVPDSAYSRPPDTTW